MNETDRLDHYLDRLANDPQAAPPPGLDPDTVDFARLLAESQQQVPASTAHAKQRVFADLQRAMVDDTLIEAIGAPQRQYTPRRAYFSMTLAAVVIVALVGGVLLLSQRTDPLLPAAGPGSQEATATSTVVITPIPTLDNATVEPTVADIVPALLTAEALATQSSMDLTTPETILTPCEVTISVEEGGMVLAEPGVDAVFVATIPRGNRLTVLDRIRTEDGELWQRVHALMDDAEVEGWILGAEVTLSADGACPPVIEWMSGQGGRFPMGNMGIEGFFPNGNGNRQGTGNGQQNTDNDENNKGGRQN